MNDSLTTRDSLIQVGRNLFPHNGFRGTSIRDLTAAAGANLGAVTYHFGSKEALYEAVIRSFIDPLRARFDAAVNAPGPVLDRIEAGVRALADHFAENPDNAPLVMHELSRGGPLPDPVREWVGHALGTFAGLIAEGQAEGSIAEGDPVLTAGSLIAQPFFFAATRRPRERTPGIAEAFPAPAAITDHVCAFIRRSLPARGRTS